MVFSSVPVYLDPPNWNQHHSHQTATTDGVGGGEEAGQLPSAARNEGRPVSMAERARLAKVPQPEPALKCPRCDSTNTKFCYFNNYSLSQPRHFCKTCRRYWTRGGALRNVPVGGGCRRNKRSKSSTGGSKSSSATTDRHPGGSGSSTASSAGGGAIPLNIPPQPQLPFMACLQPQLGDYGAAAAAANMGLSFPGIHGIDAADFHLGGGSTSVVPEQWRLPHAQQFPFLPGLPPPSMGLFPFDGEAGAVDGGVGGFAPGQVHGKPTASGLITPLAAVKMEENHPHGLSLPRQYLGNSTGSSSTDQYWGGAGSNGAGWTDLSGFSCSSTGNNIL